MITTFELFLRIFLYLIIFLFKNNVENTLAKQDYIEVEGTIVETLSKGNLRVEIQNGHLVLCTVSGKMRINNIKLVTGDKVKVQISLYDLNRGRIFARLNS